MKKIKVDRFVKTVIDSDIAAALAVVSSVSLGWLYTWLGAKINKKYLKKPNDLLTGYFCGMALMAASNGFMDVWHDKVEKLVTKVTDKILEVVDEEDK